MTVDDRVFTGVAKAGEGGGGARLPSRPHELIFTALHICRAVFVTANVSVRTSVRQSVRPSVRLSVTRVNCDKTKVPSEKSSIMTNRKSPTSFPMSLR